MVEKPDHGKRSDHWPRVRREHLEAHGECASCGGTENLEVHHIHPFHLHPDLELEPHNLITLCEHPDRLCHFRDGHAFDWHAYNPHVVPDTEQSRSRVTNRKYQ